MNRITRIIPALAIAGVLSAFSASAQAGASGNQDTAWNQAGHSGRMYNPQTVETIHGRVVKVESAAPANSTGSRGVRILVKTESQTIPVHLGPNWFIENQASRIKPNDEVQVAGSKVTSNGRTFLIASEVTDGNQVLNLRDDTGRPLWAAWTPKGQYQHGRATTDMMGRGMNGSMMGGRMMGNSGNMMNQNERQNMMARRQSMESNLQKKVDRMNEATGKAKVNAISAVIDELVQQREAMFHRFRQMEQGRMGSSNMSMNGNGGSNNRSD